MAWVTETWKTGDNTITIDVRKRRYRMEWRKSGWTLWHPGGSTEDDCLCWAANHFNLSKAEASWVKQ